MVLTGISELTTADSGLVVDGPAALVCGADGTVVWAGPQQALPEQAGTERVDLGGRAVIPGFVDSHTHLVFAGDRSAEWEARMTGRPYQTGGVRTTVDATRAATTEQLASRAGRLAAEALRSGTTTLEVKSGYGLQPEAEARLLSIAGGITPETTFLGAHVVPAEYEGRRDEYVDVVCGPMLRRCAPLARWIDVFCEQGAFDGDQSRAVLLAGRAAGLGLRVHANQLGPGPGVRLGVELGAASVDHCSHLSAADIDALAGGRTVATLLPGAEFSTGSAYPGARRLLDAGVPVALASDCNPGTSFTTSMPFVVALAVREMGMTVAEAVVAATAGGAAALQRSDVGRLVPGRRADLAVLEAPSASWLGYRPGVDLVRAVARGGRLVAGSWPAGTGREPPAGAPADRGAAADR
ncbi:imidazolonepropionase [Acidiferrimicrobium sp. IK]|nr:imidazolonepropionase [Acidiferrimicrobium sp. IK]